MIKLLKALIISVRVLSLTREIVSDPSISNTKVGVQVAKVVNHPSTIIAVTLLPSVIAGIGELNGKDLTDPSTLRTSAEELKPLQ